MQVRKDMEKERSNVKQTYFDEVFVHPFGESLLLNGITLVCWEEQKMRLDMRSMGALAENIEHTKQVHKKCANTGRQISERVGQDGTPLYLYTLVSYSLVASSMLTFSW